MTRKDERVIAVVLYPDMTALDLVGSMQALKLLEVRAPYRLVTVAEQIEPIQTDTPLKLVPNRVFWEVDRPYGLLVPGGGDAALQALESGALRRYVQSAAEQAELVASIGTGSLILAELGLLKGRQATTHWPYARTLEEMGARYIRKRWVEDGKFVTAAGVTAGIDLALHLVGKLTSLGKARSAQLIIEYDPQPPFGGIDWKQVERESEKDVAAAGVGRGLVRTNSASAKEFES